MPALTFPHAVLLGVVQGVAEFLPVSSSGHLLLLRKILGLPEADAALDAAVHLGTLIALLWYFRRDLLALPRRPATLRALIVATVVTAPLGFLLRDRVPQTLGWTGLGWLITAGVLFATRGVRPARDQPGIGDAVRAGIAQALAVAPGVSRLGTTLGVTLLRGVEPGAAARFAFLLAVPPVAGQALLSLRDGVPGDPTPLVVAGLVAAAVGLCAVGPAVRWIERGRVYRFAYYLAPLGAGVTLWSIFTR
jgi:undecaprenyl-diphosphatase